MSIYDSYPPGVKDLRDKEAFRKPVAKAHPEDKEIHVPKSEIRKYMPNKKLTYNPFSGLKLK